MCHGSLSAGSSVSALLCASDSLSPGKTEGRNCQYKFPREELIFFRERLSSSLRSTNLHAPHALRITRLQILFLLTRAPSAVTWLLLCLESYTLKDICSSPEGYMQLPPDLCWSCFSLQEICCSPLPLGSEHFTFTSAG